MESQLKLSELDLYRREIDAIDHEMIRSLARRFEVARNIAAIKRQTAQPVVQPERQREVENKYVSRGRSFALNDEFMVNLYHLIHEETCRMEERVVRANDVHAQVQVDKQV